MMTIKIKTSFLINSTESQTQEILARIKNYIAKSFSTHSPRQIETTATEPDELEGEDTVLYEEDDKLMPVSEEMFIFDDDDIQDTFESSQRTPTQIANNMGFNEYAQIKPLKTKINKKTKSQEEE